ncbi:MAG: type II 3-dehydroquinate dehydratase [Pseudomonadota bacterium]
MKLALLNGPNLNLLGTREPETYGSTTLEDIEKSLTKIAQIHGFDLESMQSNAEHELVDFIHHGMNRLSGILINPGAFTHTSVALRDAFLGTNIPFVEIHVSNVYARETFRHRSYLSDIASGVIIGCGVKGYEYGLLALINAINKITD